MDQNKEITREELHQMVWWKRTPMVEKEFGLCDGEQKKDNRRFDRTIMLDIQFRSFAGGKWF